MRFLIIIISLIITTSSCFANQYIVSEKVAKQIAMDINEEHFFENYGVETESELANNPIVVIKNLFNISCGNIAIHSKYYGEDITNHNFSIFSILAQFGMTPSGFESVYCLDSESSGILVIVNRKTMSILKISPYWSEKIR